VARRFQAKYEQSGYGSYSKVAEYFGVSRAKVCYYLALLNKLPEEFVGWLEGVDDGRVLRQYAEKRLRPIARLADSTQQRNRLQALTQNSYSPHSGQRH
jgi:hypothetical protein